MQTAYDFQYLSSQLILVTWHRYPTQDEEKEFLREHIQQLEEADEPIYYISDLRRGRIISVDTVGKMSQLAKHPNYGGGTAFSKDIISKIMVKSFLTLSYEASQKAAMFDTIEEALAFLESLKSGITQEIDWNEQIVT